MPEVIVIGEFFIDEILSEFDVMPKLGEECFAKKYKRELGGGAAITACGLAKLGVRVSVLGIVGGSDGRWVTDRLSSCGVDCSHLEEHPDEPTGLTVSVSTREDRAFFSYYGANQHLTRVLRNPTTLQMMRKARHIHFACAPDADSDAPLIESLRRSRRRISIDVQSHMSWLMKPASLKMIQLCDLFFPNQQEGEWISGEIGVHRTLRKLHEHQLRGVALKLGAKGAALLWRGKQYVVDGYPTSTVDPTGAGDCFNAGFIFSWLRGRKADHCLQVANICGALSTRALGGISAFPSLQELRDCEMELGKRS